MHRAAGTAVRSELKTYPALTVSRGRRKEAAATAGRAGLPKSLYETWDVPFHFQFLSVCILNGLSELHLLLKDIPLGQAHPRYLPFD